MKLQVYEADLQWNYRYMRQTYYGITGICGRLTMKLQVYEAYLLWNYRYMRLTYYGITGI